MLVLVHLFRDRNLDYDPHSNSSIDIRTEIIVDVSVYKENQDGKVIHKLFLKSFRRNKSTENMEKKA